MKKILFILALALPMLSFGQSQTQSSEMSGAKESCVVIKDKYLTYSKSGFVFSNTDDKFITIDAPCYKKQELFDKMTGTLNKIYTDKDQVSPNRTDSELSILVCSRTIKAGWFMVDKEAFIIRDMIYTLKFKFEDGKIQMYIPIINKVEAKRLTDREYKVYDGDILGLTNYFSMAPAFNNLLTSLLTESYNK